jgi:hypothetical protein
MRLTTALALTWALCLATTPASSQTVQLRQLDTGATDIHAFVGDTLTVEVSMDFGELRASGIAINISLPSVGLAIVDRPASRPFTPGMFVAGQEFANEQVSHEQIFGLPAGSALLSYAVVLGPGDVRFRSGSGAVATFDVLCTAPVEGSIHVVHTAAHQSMVVLDDGRSELALKQVTQINLAVSTPAAKRSSGTWAAIKTRVQ